MVITFGEVNQFEGWDRFPSFIQELIKGHSLRHICEVGAGANPAISPEFVQEHGLNYEALDENEGEVSKSGLARMSVIDICAADCELPGAPYDLIFSRMAAEHFRNPTHAYMNMFRALVPGGLCVHSFATLYALPFLLNRMLPDSISDLTLDRVSPRIDRDRHEKFKAYYFHCRGPMKHQVLFYQDIGYEVLEYRGYFGHNYYHMKLPFLHLLEKQKTRVLLKAPVACLTSYSTIILRRPGCR
jgi:SAM-dependent methyltransferase